MPGATRQPTACLSIHPLAQAEENSIDWKELTDYIGREEIFCCQLMEEILSGNRSVLYTIQNSRSIVGIFSYTRGGSFSGCIKKFTREINSVLHDFFMLNKTNCISGKESFVKKILSIISQCSQSTECSFRSMHMMEFSRPTKIIPSSLKIERCTMDDADAMMPLQVEYSRSEVLPHWQETYLPQERAIVEHRIRQHRMFALYSEDGTIISRLYINGLTKKYSQIGGVFTRKEFRGRGYASTLVSQIAGICYPETTPILFVNRRNIPAVRAYTKAGFRTCGRYAIALLNYDGPSHS